MTNPSVQIVPLSLGSRDVDRFLNVSYEIYRGDPNWVAPLLMDLKLVFTKKNPLFTHAEMTLWVATRDGRDVGRIAAIIDQTHNAVQKDSAAFFGFFESINDPEVSRTLFQAATDWSREKGMKRMLGPMNPTSNDECGLLVDGFDSPPVFMMTYNPRYYAGLVEAEGYRKAKDLLAFHMGIRDCPLDRLERIAAIARKRHPEVTYTPVRAKTLARDLGKVKDVYNAAWEDNWGFVPMTDAEIDFMASRLKPLLLEGLLWVAETKDEPVGFILGLPDFNVAIKPLRGRLLNPRFFGFLPYLLGWKRPKWIRAITLGVKAKYRNRGLEAVMLSQAYQAGIRMGFTDIESSWILENNTMMCRIIETFGGRVYKTYRLYEKDI